MSTLVKATNKAVKEISDLAQETLDQQAVVSRLEAELKEQKAKLNTLETELLPTAMQSAHVSKFETENKVVITLKDDIQVSIPKATKPQALKWLVDNEHSGIVKTIVSLSFPAGALEKAQDLAKNLEQQAGVPAVVTQDAATGTVKAILRQELESGERTVPLDIFGAFPYTKAVVKIKN